MKTVITVFAAVLASGLALTALSRRSRRPARALRAVVSGLVGVNGVMVLACALVAAVVLGVPLPVFAQAPTTTAAAGVTTSNVAIGAALATGLACIGAGIAVGIAGAAAIGGITEKPEIMGRTLIFVGLAEGIAIYGLIISFMILNA